MKSKIISTSFLIMLFVISSSINSAGAMDTTWWDAHANTKGSGDVLTNTLNKAQIQVLLKPGDL